MTDSEYLSSIRLTLDDFVRALQVGYRMCERGEEMPQLSPFNMNASELSEMNEWRIDLLSSTDFKWKN